MSENRYVTEESLIQFHRFLQQEERSAGTIEKYMRDVKNFAAWIEDQSSMSPGFSCCEVTKEHCHPVETVSSAKRSRPIDGQLYAGCSQYVFQVYVLAGSSYQGDPAAKVFFSQQ